jgi:hypothetical protein
MVFKSHRRHGGREHFPREKGIDGVPARLHTARMTTIGTAIQLSVFLHNTPGTLAAVCKELARAKINIFALTISDTSDHSVVRMVLSDPRKALLIFEERGVLALDSKVLTIESSNEPGTLATIAQRLAKAKVNIEYAYLATSPGSGTGLLIMRVDDTKKALKILGKKKK